MVLAKYLCELDHGKEKMKLNSKLGLVQAKEREKKMCCMLEKSSDDQHDVHSLRVGLGLG